MKFDLIRILLITFCCTLAVSKAVAQKGFVRGPSLYMTGTIVGHGIYRNNREIEFMEGDEKEVQIFHPADLIEFRIEEEDIVYTTKIIEDNGVKTAYFLLEQVRGNAKLYVLKTKEGFRFFGEKQNQLVELKDDGSFKTTLAEVLDHCPNVESYVPLVKRTKASLTRAFSLHHRCYTGAFPRLRFGVFVGYSSSIFEVRDLRYNYTPMRGYSPFFGAFVDTPTGLNPKWFANVQIQYQHTTYQNPPRSNVATSNFQISTTILNFPILLKYKSTAKKMRPYVLAGPTFSFFTQHDSHILENIPNGVSQTVYFRPIDNISPFQINVTVGLGIEYSLNVRNSVGLEVRYSAGSGIRSEYNQSVTSLQVMGTVYF